MTLDQGLAFAVLTGLMTLFVWGPLRYDVVALLGLLVAVLVGIVPPEKAFSGFSDDVVVIVGSALVVSAAVAQSGFAERLLQPIAHHLTAVPMQMLVLVGAVTALSAFVKNVGALAILMPVALAQARRTGTPPSYLLMPLAFGSLLGGLITQVGTSPNIIVSRIRAEILGQPFSMFDFTPVGVGLALTGLLFLTFGYRLLPAARKGKTTMDAAFTLQAYTTEVRLLKSSPVVGKRVADLEALGSGDVAVTTIIRERYRRYTPAADWVLLVGDILLLQGEPASLERLRARAGLELATHGEGEAPIQAQEGRALVEAVVTTDSPLVERSPAQLHLRGRYGINLIALSRRGEPVTHRLRSIRFQPGDVVVLQGERATLPDTLGELRCLPLAERGMPLGRRRHGLVPILVLGLAVALVALHVLPVAIAFFGAAVALLLLRVLTPGEAYSAIDWPILFLLAALIPVSDALRTTGATELIAGWLSMSADQLPPLGALAMMMAAGMAVTPFLNNAATVLVMGPVAASLAANLGLNPDPFLMAVAIGAACDFLTPIGHQCNTLVMGPGGYHFGDYWRLGLPLSILVLIVGTLLIQLFWPLRVP